jgi:uncharacterized DUF497 family protein
MEIKIGLVFHQHNKTHTNSQAVVTVDDTDNKLKQNCQQKAHKKSIPTHHSCVCVYKNIIIIIRRRPALARVQQFPFIVQFN